MVPNVFVDIELIDIIENDYELTTRIIRKMDGMSFLVIEKSCIEECFKIEDSIPHKN